MQTGLLSHGGSFDEATSLQSPDGGAAARSGLLRWRLVHLLPCLLPCLLHGFPVKENPRGYGTARVAPEKSDNAIYLAEPVSDYWQALHRVSVHLDRMGEFYDAGPLPFVVHLVADIFWIHPEQVRRDLIKIRRSY